VKNRTSFNIEHCCILRFVFVGGLTTIVQACGLGVGDKQNDIREVEVLSVCLFLC
jgi:putative flippase GtrA